MKHIKRFYEYNQIYQYEKILSINEKELFYTFIDYYYNSDLITIYDRKILEKYTNFSLNDYLINENFFDKLKNRYDKAASVVKNIPDNAKQALNTIIDAAKTSVDFVKNLVNQLNNFIKKVLTETSEKIKNKLKLDQNFINQIKSINSKNKKGIITDLKTCKDVLLFYNNKLSNILSSKLTTAFTQVVTSDDLPIEEKLIYIKESLKMGKNVISSLIHGIEKVPPFSWLTKVKEMTEKGVNNIVGALSYFTQQLGGPKFTLPVIASLLGIAFEYNIKGLAKYGLLDIIGLATIPYVALLIKIIAYIATFTAAILVIDDVLNLNILQHHKHTTSEQEAKSEQQNQQTTKPEQQNQQVKPTQQQQVKVGTETNKTNVGIETNVVKT